MKHLPSELLYLLKIYNFIMYDVGLEFARSHSEEIRDYISKADFLDAYPTVREYLSEDKSIDDIITYIQRNEKTYSLLGEWKDGEIEALFKSKGLEGAFGFSGAFSVKKEGDNAFFLLPNNPYSSNKILLLNADLAADVNIEKILWLEFYKTRDGMCLEIFDDCCKTLKVSFPDFEIKKVFHSAAILSEGAKNTYDSLSKMASAVFEKYEYDNTLLNDREKKLLPVIYFLESVKRGSLSGEHPEIDALFLEYGIAGGQKILSKAMQIGNDKKAAALAKKMARLLRSKKCIPLMDKLNKDMIASQKLS